MKEKLKINKNIIVVSICVIFLSVFGCIMVYSASMYSAQKNFNSSTFFLIKQIVGVALGVCGLVFFSFFDYKKLKMFCKPLLLVSIILLVLVFIPGIGVENYGAKRWIGLFGITIQPSEIAKFAFVLFASVYLSKHKTNIKRFSKLLPVIFVGGIFCLLIITEPNMSITMCLGLVMIIMLLVGGISIKHFLLISIPLVILVPVLILLEPYRISRLMAFLNPWANPKGEGFQLIESLYSLGSGGLFGVGLFSSRQKYLYLPFAESDFVFAIIGEELGFFGSCLVVLTFLTLIYFIVKIAISAKDRFATLLCIGIASVIAVQVILNIAVVTGSIPPTGLPLPFISAGSTSLLVFMSAIGVVLNVDRQSRKKLNFISNVNVCKE